MMDRYISIQQLMDEVSYATEEGAKLSSKDFEILIDHMPASACILRDELTDTPFLISAIDAIVSERRHQIEKWGADTDNSPFEWMSILGEEYGELCEAVNETFFRNPTHPELGGYEKIIKEASQVAAVAAAIIESAFVWRAEHDL